MNQLAVDLGLEEYALFDGAVLRFNPADPNLYARFLELEPRLEALQKGLQQNFEADEGMQMIELLRRTDQELKELLTSVFGPQNDFSRLMQGINLLAVGQNGLTVAENLLTALEPVLLSGAERFVRERTREACRQARQRRASQ